MAAHDSKDDVWMSIHNKVYNVTKYLEDHPGGEQVLLDRGGKDATEDYEDVGHSNEARKQLAPFEIGELPPSERDLCPGDCVLAELIQVFASAPCPVDCGLV